MSSLTAWLIRHGETTVNTGVWSDKPFDAHLTAVGQEQAKKLVLEVTVQPDLLITSPLPRTKETAEYLAKQWPAMKSQVWPIQELIYLSPTRLQHMSTAERKEEIQQYWQQNDPDYTDGLGTESFAAFFQRVADFHVKLLKQQGFVVVIGHGQFFKAYQLGLSNGFTLNPDSMKLFRQQEITHPIKNGDILKINFLKGSIIK